MISDGSPKRRRWLIRLLVIGILLAGVPLAWRFRPMSETELLLVGSWQVGSEPERSRFILTRGRRIVAIGGGTKTLGTWHASDGKLYISYDQPFPRTWREVPVYLKQIVSRDHGLDIGPIDLEFEGTTRVRCLLRIADDSALVNEVLERAP